MKIGILTSGNDMLTLFSFLQRYDHEYIVWYDDLFFSWGDKPLETVLERVQIGMEFLKTKSVDCILVPPTVELHLLGEKTILPLFQTYLMEHCFPYSLVGKIGFLGDWLDIQTGQHQLENLAKNYILTDNQRAIRKFQVPFAWRGKEVRNWKYLLDTLSWSDSLVNTLVKNDVKYFKDAGVDTLLPMNYSYFHVEKTIKKTLNFKKMRFHGIKQLEAAFTGLMQDNKIISSNYQVNVYYTGHGEFLKRDKRLMWLLGKGKGDQFITVCKSS